jgi:hypothetical protein
MKAIVLKAKIRMNNNASTFFEFVITRESFRISFWPVDSNQSTFSEIRSYTIPIEIEKSVEVIISLIELDVFKNKLN